MDNHFHLLLKEIQEGGVSRFMQSICGSMSRHYNEKYQERGSIFQGPYRSRTIDSDRYLRWVVSYILVKNVFELFPGGYTKALENFDDAWKWAKSYEYSGFKDFVGHMSKPTSQTCGLESCYMPILDMDILKGYFKSEKDLKEKSRDMIFGRRGMRIEEVSFQ